MNRTETLLVVATEECAETAQAITKLNRFGNITHNNSYDVMYEFYQLSAVINMLQQEGVLPVMSIADRDKIMNDKVNMVNSYMNHKASTDNSGRV